MGTIADPRKLTIRNKMRVLFIAEFNRAKIFSKNMYFINFSAKKIQWEGHRFNTKIQQKNNQKMFYNLRDLLTAIQYVT